MAGGAISGSVTDASTHGAVAGVCVDVYDHYGSLVESTSTDASGSYTASIGPGAYRVGFEGCAANYLPQFYNGKADLAAADSVSVTPGTTTSGVDAALQAGGGRISGTVTSATTGAALAGVCVDVYDASGNVAGRTSTDTGGHYTASGLPAGSYSLGFSGCGSNYQSQFYNGKSSQGNADPVAVSDGASTTGIDAALQPGGQITGTVTDATTGAAAPGICVSAYGTAYGYATTSTDAAGHYALTALPTGSYAVQFSGCGANYVSQSYNGKPNLQTADAVGVVQGTTTSGINAALQPGGVITGTVTDAKTSAALAGICVSVYDSTGVAVASATSDGTGSYTVTGLAPGSHRVGFSGCGANYLPQFDSGESSLATADAISVTSGGTSSGVDAVMQPGGQVAGTVTNASTGAAIAHVAVGVLNSSGGLMNYACTAADGTYVVSALPTGTYHVGFTTTQYVGACSTTPQNFVTQYYNGKPSLATADPVSVTQGSTTPAIDSAMQVGGEISGTVTNASTSVAIQSAYVTVSDLSGNQLGATSTDASGHYTLVGLASGTYHVEFSAPNYLLQYYNGRPSAGAADGVTVTQPGTTSGMDASLQPASSIVGTVTDASTGAAIAGEAVTVFGSSSPQPVAFARTDSGGHYTASGLAAGTYRVSFSGGNYLTQYYNGKTSQGAADPVAVGVGSTTAGIDASMQAAGRITGTVTDSLTGTPIQNIEVDLFGSGGNPVTSTCTAPDGTYSFGALTTGSYRVGFAPTRQYGFCSGTQPNYLPEFYNGKSSLTSADPVSVTQGLTTSGINAVLQAGGQATGTVTDAATSAGISGICVTVYDANGAPIGYATTGSGGSYTVGRLPGGSYKVGFTGCGSNYLPQFYNGKASLASADTISVTQGSATSGIDAALQTGAQIIGKVTNALMSAAIQDVAVEAYDSNGNQVGSTCTAADGTYTLSALPTGSYRLGFITQTGRGYCGNLDYAPQFYNGRSSLATADAIAVTRGSTTSGIDAALSPGGHITGTVTDATTKAPLAGICVTVYDSSGVGIAYASTDSSGSYTVTGLGTGSYRVGFDGCGANYVSQFYSGQSSLPTATAVAVSAAATVSAVDAALQPSGQITGTVTDATTTSPVAGVCVTVYDASSSPVGYASTDAAGNYTVTGLAAGPYRVGFAGCGLNYQSQFYKGQASLGAADSLSVAPGSATSGINASLSPASAATPINTSAPTISGTAQQGHTLTEHNGSWTNSPTGFTYQWFRCDSAGTNCTAITGATNQTYALSADDVGHTIEVQETASNTIGPGVAVTSAPTTAVLPPPPTNVSPPTISGRAQQGQVLTEHPGSWTNSPTGFAYQWLRCDSSGLACVPISGAMSQTYVPAAGDVGYTLEVQETAGNAGGSSAPTSSLATDVVVPPVPVNTVPPTISGTAQQNQTLSEQSGSWTNNPSPVGYSYQWLQCDSAGANCTPITGARNQTYVPVAGDVGHTIEVQETARNTGGASSPATSAPTAVVLPAPPVNLGPPAISGTAQQGQTLTEQAGSWTNNPTGFTYQWLQCDNAGANCTPISAATNQTYVPPAGDVGHTLEVQETASNAGGTSAPATSGPTPVVLPAIPGNTSPPGSSGSAEQGQTLTEHNGGWTNQPTSFAYQWLQCDSAGANCTKISKATDQSYVPVAGDVGHTIEVQETASNAGGTSDPATSSPTATVIGKPPANTSLPTISGTAQQDQVLTEANGGWTNQPASFAYQWLQCDSASANCTPISGAINQTYVPQANDVGHTIEVQETASNATGPSTPAGSQSTTVVLPAPPANSTPPAITGTAQQDQTLTEHQDTWTNNPTRFTYQWLQCDNAGANCNPISGATNQTYVPNAGDVGHTIEVQEVAANAGGSSAPATSAVTAVIVQAPPVNTGLPTITGTAQQDQTLTERQGAWNNNPTGFTYQWIQCDSSGLVCTVIAGATRQTYTPTAGDVGHTLEVQETASNATGNSAPATSRATAAVVPPVPVNTRQPAITGAAQQGQTLSDQSGSWTNNPSPLGFAYTWLRCDSSGTSCAPISGATGQTYLLTADDVGHTIEAQETATNAGGSSLPATSLPTASVVGEVPGNTALPTISGTARQGQKLSEQNGSWTNQPTSVADQWLQCDSSGANCTPISGATSQDYVATADDVGHKLEVQETATNGTGSASVLSAPTAIVLMAVPTHSGPPTLSGTVAVGQALTESHGTWTGSPTSYAYQWQQCDASGGSCAVIAHAEGPAYTPVDADVGHTIKVQETATNAGGDGLPVSSAATVPVPAPPLAARVGEDVQATTNLPVTLDGSGSTPGDRITSYHWIFGDGASADGASATHAYSQAGIYTATLTVSDGSSSASQSLTVTVTSPPPQTALITVETAGAQPISGADVAYIAPNGTRTSVVTGADGQAALTGLPDGTDVVYVYANGFSPSVASVAVRNGSGQTLVKLQSGQVATTSLTSQQLTQQEIIDAGINPNDPANRVVFKFEVHLAFWPDYASAPSDVNLGGYVNSDGSFVGNTGGGGGGGVACTSGGCSTPDGTVVPYVVDGHPMLEWLIFGGQASFLKQFFRLTLLVQNLSPQPFNLSGGHGRLNLPDGLSLAPTAAPQSLTRPLDDIPADGSASTTWLVRGDAAGSYQPSAEYTGTLQPVGAPIDVQATLQDPMQVYGAGSLKVSVEADSGATDKYPYHVRIGLTNTASSPVYNAQVQLDPTKHVNFLYQPQERLTRTFDTIPAGQTVWTDDFILAPQITGTLDVGDSFVVDAAGQHNGSSAVSSHPTVEPPASAPAITAVPVDGQIELAWAPVPGATSYRVFSTPDRNTPFGDPSSVYMLSNGAPQNATVTEVDPSQLDPSTNLIHARVDAPIGQLRWYAVSSIINGVPTLEHPLMPAVIPPTPPTVITRPASDLSPVSATLNGSVDPAGATLTNCHFEFGPTTAYGTKIPCAQTVSPGHAPSAVSAPTSGLSEGKTYHFRLVAANGTGTINGDDLSFTTPVPGPPVVTTESAGPVSRAEATLNGAVTPQGAKVTDCHFEFGTDPNNLDQSAPCAQTLGGDFVPAAVSAKLAQVEPEKTYRFRLVATNSYGTSVGQTLSFQTCDKTEVKAKDTLFDAVGCFRVVSDGIETSTQTVRVNGIDFVPSAGHEIKIDEAVPAVYSDGPGKAVIGGKIGIWDWHTLALRMDGDWTLPSADSLSNKTKIFGFPLNVKLKGNLQPDGEATLGGTINLRKLVGSDVAATLNIVTSNEKGISGAQFSLDPAEADPRYKQRQQCKQGSSPPHGFTCEAMVNKKGNTYYGLNAKEPQVVKLFGFLPLEGLGGSYDAASGDWGIEGTLAVSDMFPQASSVKKFLPTLTFSIKGHPDDTAPLVPFRFTEISLADSDFSIPLGPVTIHRLSLFFRPGTKTTPFSASGGFGLSAGPPGSGKVITIDGEAAWTNGENTGFDARISGDAQLKETLSVKGFVELDLRDQDVKLLIGGGFTRSFKVADLSLAISGGVQVKPSFSFQLEGDGKVDVFGATVGAHGIVSTLGVGGCGELHVHVLFLNFDGEVGVEHYWSGPRSGETDFAGCDFSGLYAVGGTGFTAAVAAQPFTLPAGRSKEELAFVGAHAPPAVTLISPTGQRIKSAAKPDHLTPVPGALTISVTSTRTTYFILPHPAGGRWRVLPAPGTPAPARIELASPLQPLGIRVHVTGRGQRRRLNWSFRAQRGVQVRFIESGGEGQTLLQTARGTGSMPFAPAPGHAGKRKILAVELVDLFPRQVTTAATFVTAPPIPPHVAHLRYRTNRTTVFVSWQPPANTNHVLVAIRTAKGTAMYRIEGRTHAATLPATGVVAVTVTVTANGLSGHPQTAIRRR